MKLAVEAVLGVFAVLIVVTDVTPIRFMKKRRHAHTRRRHTRR